MSRYVGIGIQGRLKIYWRNAMRVQVPLPTLRTEQSKGLRVFSSEVNLLTIAKELICRQSEKIRM